MANSIWKYTGADYTHHYDTGADVNALALSVDGQVIAGSAAGGVEDLTVLDDTLVRQRGIDLGVTIYGLAASGYPEFGVPPEIDDDLDPAVTTCVALGSFDYEITILPGAIPEPTYQWKHRHTDGDAWEDLVNAGGHIAGATSAHLYITNAVGEDYGLYECVVSNAAGSDTSETATIRITPTITVQPTGDGGGTSATRCIGDLVSAVFSVTAVGGSVGHPLSYQWHRVHEGVDISLTGKTASTITLATADLTLAAVGEYYCVVSNTYNPTYSVSTSHVMLYITLAGFAFLEESVEKSSPVELYDLIFGTRYWRMTSADSEITWQGNKYLPVPIQRTQIILASAQELDLLEITMPATHEFPAMFVDIVPGRMAKLTITRIHRYDELVDTSAGYVVIFKGYVQSVAFSRNNFEARLAVTPMSMNLNKTVPLWTYQSMCNHMLFDAGCGLDEDAVDVGFSKYKAACTVTVSSGNRITVTGDNVNAIAKIADVGWATAGFVQSGQEFRTILDHQATGILELILPFYYPLAGTSVVVSAGCDHGSLSCSTKFNNILNYLGFEFVPTKNPFSSGTD